MKKMPKYIRSYLYLTELIKSKDLNSVLFFPFNKNKKLPFPFHKRSTTTNDPLEKEKEELNVYISFSQTFGGKEKEPEIKNVKKNFRNTKTENNFIFLEDYSFKNLLKTENEKENDDIINKEKESSFIDFIYNQPYSINNVLENNIIDNSNKENCNDSLKSKKENLIYDYDNESQFSSPKFGKEKLTKKTLKKFLNVSEIKNNKKISKIINNDTHRKKVNSNHEQKRNRKNLDFNIKKPCKDYKLLIPKQEIKNIQVIKLNKLIVKDKKLMNKNIEINKNNDTKNNKSDKTKKLTHLINIHNLNTLNLNNKLMPKFKFQNHTCYNKIGLNILNNIKDNTNNNLYTSESKDISDIFSEIESSIEKNKKKSKAVIKISRNENIPINKKTKSLCISPKNNFRKLIDNSTKQTSSKIQPSKMLHSSNQKIINKKITKNFFRNNTCCIQKFPNYYFNISPFSKTRNNSDSNNLSDC